MSFCTHCGKQLTEGERCSCHGAQEAAVEGKEPGSKLPKSKRKLIIPAALIVIVLIIIIALVSHGGSTIDLNDYLIVEGVTGLNGRGAVSYYLDEDALMAAMFNASGSKDVKEDDLEAAILANYEKFEEIGNALSCIQVSVTPDHGLSNGETATVTATFENTEDYKISYRFKNAEKTITVSGLAEGKSVDPFAEENISVTFTGFSGTGTASFETLSTDEIFSYYHYSLSKWCDLSNGDTITLNVSYNPQELEARGYLSPGVLAKDYTVSGLTEYFDVSDGFPADMLQDLTAKSLAGSQAKETSEEYATVIAPSEVTGVYFMKAENPTYPYKDLLNGMELNNAVAIMTHYTVSTGSFFTFDVERWYFWVYPNWYLDADGNLVHESEQDSCYFVSPESQEKVLPYLDLTFYGTEISEMRIAP